MAIKSREGRRELRRDRVRKRVRGTDQQPRLCIYRSLRFTYAQLISDESNQVLATASTKEAVATGKSQKSVDSAREVGKRIAALAKEKNISRVTFDRNGFLYHGRIQAVAEGAREAGLEF